VCSVEAKAVEAEDVGEHLAWLAHARLPEVLGSRAFSPVPSLRAHRFFHREFFAFREDDQCTTPE
jgi:hypothetical protein